ncbi:MAG: ATP-dependent DNA ligase [Candidatus Aenigmarchaeota archaeon]|jgi:DNA ligase-1|nr:ATP-dependent DNA ligase [Candidatus Aenigmarchaeota archaeon]
MEYKLLCDYYERLEKESSKLEKTKILAELFSRCSLEELEKVVFLVQGIVYPKYTQLELGVATQLMIKAMAKAYGTSEEKIEEEFARLGDLGLVAEKLSKNKKQVTLVKKSLSVEKVFEELRKLPLFSGEGSQERKIQTIYHLLLMAEPKEAKYVTRTILGELRIGVAEGLIRDAIVEAFLPIKTKEEKEKSEEAVDYAWNILSDFSLVAKIAKEKGIEGLKNVKIEIGRPIQVMLGEKAESIEEVVREFGEVAAEWKYDGMRTIVMKKNDKVWLFTRRQEDVTKQFPDLVELCKKGIKANECVIEGETIAVDPKTNIPMAFQVLSQRIHRKYDIEKMIEKIPIQIHLFDIVYLNGEMLIDKPLIERRKILESIIEVIPGKFELAKQIITKDVKKIEEFYNEAINAKQEGLMLKVLNSPYRFGRHVGGWYKIKPTMENLDLVIVGATWGEGARANWLTSFELAVRDPDTGNFLRCGMMSTGLTEEEYEMMTEMLKPLIIQEKGKEVKVKPKIVVEVKYQEIQKSPNYESGYALRFPAFVRLREDKGPEEADTIERLVELYKSQGKAG